MKEKRVFVIAYVSNRNHIYNTIIKKLFHETLIEDRYPSYINGINLPFYT